MDFRDRVYSPPLIEVPPVKPLSEHLRHQVPVLDQVSEGACVGYALATLIHRQLLVRTPRDTTRISVGMLYEMARRYDEWPEQKLLGSSARGAMKGWFKHGVCAEALWPYDAAKPDRILTEERAADAAKRPLGVYYRVYQRDLSALHSALTECGVLFATGMAHKGWREVPENLDDEPGAVIQQHSRPTGGHAFALVGYDHEGFWVQNSWGASWGYKGCAKLRYQDWLANGQDVWAARLGVPVLAP